MIKLSQIHIGTRLRTNKGEIITVESISTKHQHRKVGYHLPDDPQYFKYVRLVQCTEIIETPITQELLAANGWKIEYYSKEQNIPNFASMHKDKLYACFVFGRNSLDIWTDFEEHADSYSDISIRVCPTAEKLSLAFQLAGINYTLTTNP